MPRMFTGSAILGLVLLVTTSALAQGNGNGGGGGGRNKASLSVEVFPDSFSETDAGATGIVIRENSDTSVGLTVSLKSSDTSEATVPGSVQIPVGESSAEFEITAVDDTKIDGDQPVTISVTAPDHSGAETAIAVIDDDGLAYSIQWISVPFYPLYDIDGFSVMDLNESGQFVGRLQESVIDTFPNPRIGIFFDGSQVIAIEELPAMTDLSADGWFASVATGINDSGQIAVAMENVDGSQDVFRYEPTTETFTRTFSGSWGPVAINNHGDLAFANYSPAGDLTFYFDEVGLVTPKFDGLPLQTSFIDGFNDSVQVCAVTSDPDTSTSKVFRYDAALDSLITFSGKGSGETSINSSGDVLFSHATSVKRNRVEYSPAVYVDNTDQVETIAWDSIVHSDINDRGDVLLHDPISFKPYLLLSDGGTVVIDTEVQGTDLDVSKWQTAIVADQTMNDSGQIAGAAYVTLPDGTEKAEFFILTPVQPTP